MASAGTGRRSSVPLQIDGLSISYGPQPAVRNLSIHVAPGEIYGLLGSNGAGKTSTIKSVVGLVTPTAGTIRVFGLDAAREGLLAKQLIGYVPEAALLYDSLTPREFLEFLASVRKLPSTTSSDRLARYAEAFRLSTEVDEPLATLSTGTRQKVLVIAALLHQPSLLVLDEPLNNLDPRSVRIMKDLLSEYAQINGHGVLFSTHTMEIAEKLCHRVGILDRGELMAEGTLPALRDKVARGDATLEEIFLRLTAEEEGVREAVRALRGA